MTQVIVLDDSDFMNKVNAFFGLSLQSWTSPAILRLDG